MAFIEYVPLEGIPEEDRVPDEDHIVRVSAVHSAVMRHHFELYRELMYSRGPLTRAQREMIGVRVSALNRCRY